MSVRLAADRPSTLSFRTRNAGPMAWKSLGSGLSKSVVSVWLGFMAEFSPACRIISFPQSDVRFEIHSPLGTDEGRDENADPMPLWSNAPHLEERPWHSAVSFYEGELQSSFMGCVWNVLRLRRRTESRSKTETSRGETAVENLRTCLVYRLNFHLEQKHTYAF